MSDKQIIFFLLLGLINFKPTLSNNTNLEEDKMFASSQLNMVGFMANPDFIDNSFTSQNPNDTTLTATSNVTSKPQITTISPGSINSNSTNLVTITTIPEPTTTTTAPPTTIQTTVHTTTVQVTTITPESVTTSRTTTVLVPTTTNPQPETTTTVLVSTTLQPETTTTVLVTNTVNTSPPETKSSQPDIEIKTTTILPSTNSSNNSILNSSTHNEKNDLEEIKRKKISQLEDMLKVAEGFEQTFKQTLNKTQAAILKPVNLVHQKMVNAIKDKKEKKKQDENIETGDFHDVIDELNPINILFNSKSKKKSKSSKNNHDDKHSTTGDEDDEDDIASTESGSEKKKSKKKGQKKPLFNFFGFGF